MGKRGSDPIPQKSAKTGGSDPIPQKSAKTGGSDPTPQKSAKTGKRSSDPIPQKSAKMGKRCSDPIPQKSAKKSRELKDLGPTLEELEYGCEPDGTPSRPAFWMDSNEEEDWRKRRQTYSSDDEDYTPSPEEKAEYLRQSRIQAEAGLEYYNKKNGTNYELVEALDYVTFLVDALWVHCNFTAKPQMDAEPQLFFAEMHYSHSLPRRMIVVTCRLLKEGKTKTTTEGCESCRGELSIVIHPTKGFRRGHPQYEARTLRSRAGWV